MSATPAVPASPADVRSLLTEEFLRKFDTPGPRYTSYPTADRFTESFGPAQTVEVLTQLRDSSSAAPLSLYVHIPFCEQLCYYCGCNKIITKHHERAARYLDVLEAELALVVLSLGTGRPVSQLHFGGGSPTFLSDEELTRVMRSIGAAFRLTPDSEVSIEVDPRTVTPQRLAHFRTLGFNRLSFGVQDFDPDVQKAVHVAKLREKPGTGGRWPRSHQQQAGRCRNAARRADKRLIKRFSAATGCCLKRRHVA